MKTLVILESASKIKKVQAYLGNEYLVKACFGHVRDLKPKSLSVEIDNDYKPIYDINQDKKKIVKELKDAFKSCGKIILACDLDREGEAISFHLSEILKLKEKDRKRLLFNEITKSSLTKAIKELKPLDNNMVNAQQARRVVDRLIGYLISPLLWKHIQNSYKKKISLSAGRVQSVVLKLIIENEEEIKKHKPESYYELSGEFQHKIKAKYEDNLESKEEALDFMNNANDIKFTIDSNIKKKSKSAPPKPFITSTLQQEASNRFHFSPKQTMAYAQKLYEQGHITYMRTDSYNLSNEFLEKCESFIKDKYGEKYYEKHTYKSNSETSQEAHEAIRPTNLEIEEATDDTYQQKLYRLIWERSVASQMKPSLFDSHTLKIGMDIYEGHFVSKFNKTTFDGYKKVFKNYEENKEENNAFPVLIKEGTIINYESLNIHENISKSKKARFTEASLIKQLDKLEIGRPSTYSSMVSVVQERNYVEKKDYEGDKVSLETMKVERGKKMVICKQEKVIGAYKNKLVPNSLGYIVNEFMNKYFENIIDYNFTKNFEKELDKVSAGNLEWTVCVDNVYKSFKECLDLLREKTKDNNKRNLGNHPDTDLPVYAYVSKYGPVLQYNDNYVNLKDIKIDEVTLEQALPLLKYPWKLSDKFTIKKGKYGFYFSVDGKNYSLGKIDESEITVEKCEETIKAKSEGVSNVIKKFADLTIMNGKYGPYINYKGKNYKIYGNKEPKDMTKEECMKLVKKKK